MPLNQSFLNASTGNKVTYLTQTDPAPMEPSLTEEQQSIINTSEDFIAVTAYAGTGKTSTLKAYANLRPKGRMLYLAFNKAMAYEAKESFADLPRVEVKTLHSLAFAVVGHKYQDTLGQLRPYDLVPYLGRTKLKEEYGLARILFELINSWMLSDSLSVNDFLKKSRSKISMSLKEFNLTPGKISPAINLIWDDMINKRFIMPHNGYFKLFQLSQPKLDYYTHFLIDEAQDLNDAMISVLFGLKGIKILVGDPFQQIYGWNGAVNALPKAEKRGAAPYYLTNSFRCPNDIGDIANSYLTLLGAKRKFNGLNERTRRHQKSDPLAIIARTNAAIFDHVAMNMDSKRFCYNGGFDGYQFEILKDINHLRSGNSRAITDNFIKKFKNFEALEKYVNDAADTAMHVRLEVEKKYGSQVHGIYAAMEKKKIERETDSDTVVTTAHKIKGREFSYVCLLNDFLHLKELLDHGQKVLEDPTKYTPRTISREEFQLIYVAITRSFDLLEIPKSYLITPANIRQFKFLLGKRCFFLE
ncbi:MAG: UvrD-helicase domain-containing protein [Deltaproteobacteria bacterium]|jgi:superfamily I DNA/RNA helicase|nr:UvrD-helicase domain-containing protein [Deltaproteobacteria bacterium]